MKKIVIILFVSIIASCSTDSKTVSKDMVVEDVRSEKVSPKEAIEEVLIPKTIKPKELDFEMVENFLKEIEKKFPNVEHLGSYIKDVKFSDLDYLKESENIKRTKCKLSYFIDIGKPWECRSVEIAFIEDSKGYWYLKEFRTNCHNAWPEKLEDLVLDYYKRKKLN